MQLGIPSNIVETVAENFGGDRELLRSPDAHVHLRGEELEAQVGISYLIGDAEECAAARRERADRGYLPGGEGLDDRFGPADCDSSGIGQSRSELRIPSGIG